MAFEAAVVGAVGPTLMLAGFAQAKADQMSMPKKVKACETLWHCMRLSLTRAVQ